MNDKMINAFTALSNDRRLAIFQKICDKTHCCFYDSTNAEISVDLYSCNVGEISSTFELAPATVSHHLKELKNAGLINMQRKGKFIYLTPLQEPLEELKLFFSEILNQKPMDSPVESNILNAAKDDIPAITTLLKEANLPPDDLERWIDNFFVLTIEGKIEGCIGLEHWDDVGFLRSFVVSEDYRSKGFGIRLYNRLITIAKDMNLSSIVLLAKGASGFFEKNGFEFINRNDAPKSVKNSIQFKLEECRVYDVMKLDLN